MIRTDSSYQKIDRISKYQNIAIGNIFGINRLESKYIDTEKELISRPKSEAALMLMKLLTNKTVNRFLDSHNDYIDVLKNMKHSKYVIKIDSPWKLIFNFIINSTTVLSVLFSLNQLSFNKNNQTSTTLETLITLLFLLDFALNFFTEYINEKNFPIQNFKSIFFHYLKTWLIFDLAALIPFNLLGYPEIESFLHLSRIFKLNRIYKTFSVKNVTNYLKKNSACVSVGRQKLFLLIENCFELGREILNLLFICYFFACVWFGFSVKLREWNAIKENFLNAYEIEEKNLDEQVVICMYFIFTTLTTVGYGDYLAKNSYEMALCMLIMLLGTVWLALIMSKVTSFVMAFEKIGKAKDKLSELAVFIHSLEYIHGPIPRHLKSKLFEYFKYFWKKDRLGSLMITKLNSSAKKLLETSDPTLENLPTSIKVSIFNYLFQDYFSTFFKFFGKSDHFRYDICIFMQPRYHHNDFILFIEEKASELIFVNKGKIIVGLLNDDDELLSCFNLFPGVIIGEGGVFLGENSFADLKSESVEGMAISGTAVLSVLTSKYPKRLNEYKRVVRSRSAAMKKIMQESPYFNKRTMRTSIQARLSNIFNSVQTQKEKSLTIKDLYTDLKKHKTKLQALNKDVKKLLNSYEDN